MIGMKKVFAALFALIAAVFMGTAVFADTTITRFEFSIKDFDKAVHGARVGDFKTALTPEGAPYTGDVRWIRLGSAVSDDTELRLDVQYKIGIVVYPNAGYSVSDSFSGSINGIEAKCMTITPGGDDAYYAMEIDYTVPAPEGGIPIDTVTKLVGEPEAGTACADAGHYCDNARLMPQYSTITATVWTDLTHGKNTEIGEEFKANTVYSVMVVLQSSDNYRYTNNTEFYINDHTPDVKLYNDGKIAVLEYSFLKSGDVDLNDTVNDADAALLLKYINGTEQLNDTQMNAAKVTYSAKTKPDLRDVVAILKKI